MVQVSATTAPRTAPAETLPEPLGVEQDVLDNRRAAQLVWALVLLGIAARTVRYLLRFPLWQDEAYLAVNFLDRGYLDLTGPLENRQVAPIGFLWVQHSLVQLLGFSEYALRLFPFLCGVGSLLLFRHLAGRLLRGTALVLAVGFLAVAYAAIRYSAEAKPYSCDLLVSLGLLVLATGWWQQPERTGRLWALVAVVPLAIFFSYPAVFTAGGLGIAIAVRLWRAGTRRGWLAWFVYGLMLVGSFAALLAVSAGSQSDRSREFIVGLWPNLFPPLDAPLKLAAWLVTTHTGDMFSYPIGGFHGAGTLTLVCCLVALVVLWRKGRADLALLLLSPLVLNFVAACLKRYPYGGPVRFSIYIAPAVCLLGGLGAAILLAGRGSHPRQAIFRVASVLLLLATLAAGSIGRDLVKPYKNQQVLRARRVARDVWREAAEHCEPVCLLRDLGKDFSKRPCPTVLALYLCNQRIYSERIARGEPPRWDRVSAARPLACVHFVSPAQRPDAAGLRAWLAEMDLRYRLVGRETHPVPMTYDRRPLAEHVAVYLFVPRSAAGQ